MEKETAEKIAARAFAQSYLSDLVPSVFNTLRDHGFFYDPVERGVDYSIYLQLFFFNVEICLTLVISQCPYLLPPCVCMYKYLEYILFV